MASKQVVKYRTRTVQAPRKRRRKNGITIPVSFVGGLTPMVQDVWSAFNVGGISAAAGHISLCTTGYDPADNKLKLGFAIKKLYIPLGLSAMVHKLANRTGINRALANAGVPFIRI